MVSNRDRKRPRICLLCSHEIILLNNDEDFSWDMHKQEEIHKNSRKLKNEAIMSEKADTHMCIQRMKTFFESDANINKRATELMTLADKELANSERNKEVIASVAKIFAKVYPGNFSVRPFGSRITGLTTRETGDLDLFVDTSSEDPKRTLVESPEMENHYLRKVADYMEKKEGDTWVNINKVLTCRTPILKVLHYDTKMQCDITVMNGLGNVNTELMSMYINNIHKFRPMILMIREWSLECDFLKEMNNYALSLLVLFYFQQENYAPSVYAFEFENSNKPRTNISGFDCLCYSQVKFDWTSVKSTENVKMKELLLGFFTFYANFDFPNHVICPLLGKSLNRNIFTDNGKKLPAEMISYVIKLKNRNSEIFKLNHMNIQDPIDLAHNLTKSAREAFVKNFIDMCDSTKRALKMIT